MWHPSARESASQETAPHREAPVGGGSLPSGSVPTGGAQACMVGARLDACDADRDDPEIAGLLPAGRLPTLRGGFPQPSELRASREGAADASTQDAEAMLEAAMDELPSAVLAPEARQLVVELFRAQGYFFPRVLRAAFKNRAGERIVRKRLASVGAPAELAAVLKRVAHDSPSHQTLRTPTPSSRVLE